MYETFGQACAIARKNAYLSQELAAETMYISTRSLTDYERNVTAPPADVVVLMMEEYNAPWLGYLWLRSNPVGNTLLPEVPLRELSSCYCDLQVELDDVGAVQKEMARICRDNEVDETERPAWERGAKELRELITSALSLLLAPVQKEKAPCRAK
jgi:transcriptional regulator with XRE-family HTH domain